MRKLFFSLILAIFLIGTISASVNCTKASIEVNSISKTSVAGQTPVTEIISCKNNYNSSITVTKFGSFYSTSPSMPITINSGDTAGITLNFNQMNSPGEFSGYIQFSDNKIIPIVVNVSGIYQDPGSCQLNPSIVSFTQSVQQGVAFELPKITFNPTNCEGNMSISSAYITGGITTSGGQKPVYVKSASTREILLGVDTNGLGSLTYNTKLTVTAFSKTFQDISSINIIVTGGTNPNGQFNLNNLPVCSVSSTVLNLNSTYNLVCTGLVPDVTIEPIIDNEYIRGVGVEQTSNQYTWSFSPKKYGNTFIKAQFKYQGSIVGDLYSQEVKIQSAGGTIAGTNLKLVFTPSLESIQDGQQTLIQLVDNKTGSLVENPEIYVDAVLLTTNTSKSFPFYMFVSKNYSVRGKAPGYDDLVTTISITSKPISFNITPVKDVYYVGDIITINTNPENCSLLFDGIVIHSPFTINSFGTKSIKAIKEGYLDSTKNITIKQSAYYKTTSPVYEDWKVGKDIIVELDQNYSWYVTKDNVNISSGSNNIAKFRIDSVGTYSVYADGKFVISKTIEKSGFFKFLSGLKWYWWLAILVIFILIIYSITQGKSSGGISGVGFSMENKGD